MFDAAGKIPDGLFLGSNHPPGSFKECLDIETPSLLKFGNEMIEGFRLINQYIISKSSIQCNNLHFFYLSGVSI